MTKMSSNKPWLDGPTPKDRAAAKMWQGGPLFLIGVIGTVGTLVLFDAVWIWTILAAIAGFFWFVVGAITYWTGVE